jgi:hypothetical protein
MTGDNNRAECPLSQECSAKLTKMATISAADIVDRAVADQTDEINAKVTELNEKLKTANALIAEALELQHNLTAYTKLEANSQQMKQGMDEVVENRNSRYVELDSANMSNYYEFKRAVDTQKFYDNVNSIMDWVVGIIGGFLFVLIIVNIARMPSS